jgi:hypothetical protein
MGKKKKGKSGKRIIKRHNPNGNPSKPELDKTPEVIDESPRISERIREDNPGFGVVKIVIISLIVLIISAGVMLKLFKGDNTARGDRAPGDACKTTIDCTSGSICFAYKETSKRCMVTCPEDKKCAPGFTCTAAAEQSGASSTRTKKICVTDNGQL